MSLVGAIWFNSKRLLFSHQFNLSLSWFQVSPWLIAFITIAIAAFLAVAIIWGIRAHQRKILAGKEDLIGKIAEVKTFLKPKGTVLVQGELWKATSEKGQVKPGDEVVITKVDHLEVWVTKVK